MIGEHFRRHSTLYIIFFIATAIRIWYLYAYSQLPDWELLTVDNYYHHNLAISIADGNIFGDTTYFRAPFYVYCLALLYKIFGISWWVGRIFGLVIGLLSILVTYRIARLIFNETAGYIAALLQTFYPMVLYFESELLLEPLFMLLLQLSIYYFIKWWDSKILKIIFLSGLFLGLSAITRPTSLVIFPIFIFFILSINPIQKFKQLLLFSLGAVIIILPIFARNMAIADDPVLISSQGGINFYIGNNEIADGHSAVLPEPMGFNWQISQITFQAEKDSNRELTPGEVSSYWFKESRDWIIDNPVDFFTLYMKKLYYNISNREISNNRNIGQFFEKIIFLKYSPLSFGILFSLSIGCFVLQFKDKKTKFIVLTIITYVLITSLFFFSSRFRLPLMPFYFILSSYTLLYISKKILTDLKAALVIFSLIILTGLISFYPVTGHANNNNINYLISSGINYYAMGNNQKALDLFHEAKQIDSTFTEVNLNIGVCFLKSGIEDSALYYLNKEKFHNPLRVKADINLASINLLNKNYDSAISILENVIEQRPFDLTANRLLVRAAHFSSHYTIKDFEIIIFESTNRTGNNIYLLNEAATFFNEKEEYRSAEKQLFRALLTKPPAIETDDLAFRRDFKNSLSNFDRETGRTYYLLGYLSGINKAFGQSIEFNNKAIEKDSSISEAYFNLITAYMSANQQDKALEILNLARIKFPDNLYLDRLIQTIK